MESAFTGITGMTDLMHAVRSETARTKTAAKGDLVAEHEMLLDRLIDADVMRREEAGALLQIYRRTFEAGEGKADPARSFFECRAVYDKLAGSGTASPTALVIAASGLGSFDLVAGPDGAPVVTVYRQSYGQQGAAIGATLGLVLGGGVLGATLGGQIGGLIGGIVDEKQDDKGKGK
jgi:hypothetical protein